MLPTGKRAKLLACFLAHSWVSPSTRMAVSKPTRDKRNAACAKIVVVGTPDLVVAGVVTIQEKQLTTLALVYIFLSFSTKMRTIKQLRGCMSFLSRGIFELVVLK